MRVLIAGAGGLVGRALGEHCRERGDEVYAYSHSALDVADAINVEKIVLRDRPDAIINCAAWTDVDGCESDEPRAKAVNAIGPENLARASRKVDAVFVHISTDYVFDGAKEGFYTQRDNPNPLNIYGKAKLDGERRAQREHARTIIVRTGFIFGPGGKNFLSTVVNRARRGERLTALTNAWGTPTYSPHLAARLRLLAEKDLPGVFHIVNAGSGATYEEFARRALSEAGCSLSLLEPVESLNRPAARPRNSRLKCLLSEALGFALLPSWQAGLSDFLGPAAVIEKVSTGNNA